MVPDLTTITLPTGQRITVSADAAPRFQGFLGELSDAGAPLGNIGSYNDRNIDPNYTGGRVVKSQHALGNAVDVGDQTGRNQVSPEFQKWYAGHPDIVNAALDKYGIVSGANWQHPDLGHFELAPNWQRPDTQVAANTPMSLLPAPSQTASAASSQAAPAQQPGSPSTTTQPSSAGSSAGLPAYAWTPNAAPQQQAPHMQPLQIPAARIPNQDPLQVARYQQLLAYINSLKSRFA